MKKLVFVAMMFICGCSPSGPEPQPQPQPRPVPLQIAFSRTSVQFDSAGGEGSVDVESNYPWNAHLVDPGDSSWLTFTPSTAQSGKSTVRITATPNNTGHNRTATIGFGANDQTRSLTISQATSRPENHYSDGEVIKLQSATTATGRGIEIIVMGDGYTIADMTTGGGGRYETVMRETVEHFFSTYPYSVHRGRFNVWMVVAISNQAGINVQSNPTIRVDNKFKSVWEGGESTGIECDGTMVERYASLVATRAGKLLKELTVIMPINANIDAGTTVMQYEGFSYAMCPQGPMFKNVVVHESGGHGFAKLGDEYAYNETTPPANRVYEIQWVKEQYGWYANLDFSADIGRTSWRGFAGNPKYSMVGTFEGGSSYTRGIWRPEPNSIMIGGVLYFNAPSRWAAVRRMNELEGTPYTFEQFLLDDVVPEVPPMTPPPGTMHHRGYLRTSPPIVIMPEGKIN